MSTQPHNVELAQSFKGSHRTGASESEERTRVYTVGAKGHRDVAWCGIHLRVNLKHEFKATSVMHQGHHMRYLVQFSHNLVFYSHPGPH